MATSDAELAITVLTASDADNRRLVDQLTRLINEVYRVAEEGLWVDGAARTTAPEIADLIRSGQIAVATRGGRLIGSVRIRDVDTVAESFGEFGMLVVDPGHRGFGVGRQLVDFAERRSRANGRRAMRLELLVPRTWVHPDKEFLKAWYGRRGYEVVRTTTLDESYPHIAPLLATPCELGIYEKPL